ncbi:type II TA system antitoxin MqsA family protein [Lactiplantibacillus pentosus]|uniref:type II TA system antitoxin MqsA family protein n=1 Tax=Lactiplantibacillus pentosus TaxID=1589 RepID=UPI003C2ABB1F
MMSTEIRAIQEVYTIRGEQVTVVTKARFDHATGKQVFDQELDNKAIHTAFDAYRSKHMMITPSRIKALRQRWDLSQHDFAALFGWSDMTIATYETGALASETNSERLLALEATPELAQSLYESSKDMMTERGNQAFEEQMKNVIERRHND